MRTLVLALAAVLLAVGCATTTRYGRRSIDGVDCILGRDDTALSCDWERAPGRRPPQPE